MRCRVWSCGLRIRIQVDVCQLACRVRLTCCEHQVPPSSSYTLHAKVRLHHLFSEQGSGNDGRLEPCPRRAGCGADADVRVRVREERHVEPGDEVSDPCDGHRAQWGLTKEGDGRAEGTPRS